jgi:redox-sensitive bicupin YhaK (pirin superfamily)
MSAGRGVLHSEFNPSPDEAVHFLQIWIEPNVAGIQPSYEEKHFGPETKRGKLRLVAAPDGRDGAVVIPQDAMVYATLLDGGERVTHTVAPGRKVYVHLARGRLVANGQPLAAGDALKAAGISELTLERGEGAEALLFDLP